MAPKTLNTSAVRQVVRDHGGWSECVEHRAYAEYLLGELTPGLDTSVGFTPRIRVVATAEPAALAVTPGDVLVSEGLLDWATADEARAAIAHELGHLVEAECGVVSSLLGKVGMSCPEARADRFGVGLLEIAGHDPAAMGKLLKRLADHPAIGGEVRHHLAHRHGLTHLH